MKKNEVEAYLPKLANDEPIFILRAQDKFFAQVIRYWANCVRNGIPHLPDPVREKKIREALDCADEGERWGQRNNAKLPD